MLPFRTKVLISSFARTCWLLKLTGEMWVVLIHRELPYPHWVSFPGGPHNQWLVCFGHKSPTALPNSRQVWKFIAAPQLLTESAFVLTTSQYPISLCMILLHPSLVDAVWKALPNKPCACKPLSPSLFPGQPDLREFTIHRTLL